jgi:hypothetical protein
MMIPDWVATSERSAFAGDRERFPKLDERWMSILPRERPI